MNELKIFENPEFGGIRAVEVNGEPWLVGKDVAAALGYSNAKDALSRHVDPEDKEEWRIIAPSGEQGMTIINEFGLYALVLSSKLPSAKKFRRWLTEEAKDLFHPIICPDTGAFIAWKKAHRKDGTDCIVKLRVCDDALRSSAGGRKCRCSKAEVLEVQTLEGETLEETAVSLWRRSFQYIPGQIAEADGFDLNRWRECSNGIHFYITREEAVRNFR